MKQYTTKRVTNHLSIFERTTFKMDTRELLEIRLIGNENIVYRFTQHGIVKNLVLSIPYDCPKNEVKYAKKAFELIAFTLFYS